MIYRTSLTKDDVLNLYDEEIEPMMEEVRRQMRLDALRIDRAVFEVANLSFDEKGRQRKDKLKRIRSELKVIEREISRREDTGWLHQTRERS